MTARVLPVGAAAADPERHPFGVGSHRILHWANDMPDFHPIKGIIRADGARYYHRPDSCDFDSTIPEVWFDSPAAAEAAGFRLAPSHPADASPADFEPGGSQHGWTEAEVEFARRSAGAPEARAAGAEATSTVKTRDDATQAARATSNAGVCSTTRPWRDGHDADAVVVLGGRSGDVDTPGLLGRWFWPALGVLGLLLLLTLLASQCGGDEEVAGVDVDRTPVAVDVGSVGGGSVGGGSVGGGSVGGGPVGGGSVGGGPVGGGPVDGGPVGGGPVGGGSVDDPPVSFSRPWALG